jgi:CRISPR-associated protein Cmr6
MRTDWRFVPGLGRGGSLEVGFAFDRYGFPVLPGSSVKGIARSYAWLVEGRRGDDPEFEAIFGREADPSKEDPGASGGAVFFAAIPREVPKLDLDVMTPHVPNYYGGQQPPTNWQSPNPVYFLTVAPQTPFRFAVGWRTALDSESARLRGLAETWLREGLRTLGAGAKTSSGYGFFA